MEEALLVAASHFRVRSCSQCQQMHVQSYNVKIVESDRTHSVIRRLDARRASKGSGCMRNMKLFHKAFTLSATVGTISAILVPQRITSNGSLGRQVTVQVAEQTTEQVTGQVTKQVSTV